MRIKGHTTIILKDVKTGNVERYDDSNMMTNAIAEYFENCGFMNYPDLDKNNLVELLLGGVMAFDDEISESASIVHAPAGLKMIANGSVGTVNNSEVLELGSYSTTESGWQNDGSYIQVYDYSTSQANGTIACVCLTGKDYGFIGEGNSISNVRHQTRADITSLKGYAYTLSGYNGYFFNVDIANSSFCTFAIENRTNTQTNVTDKVGVVRKYRLHISKLNLKGKMTEPVLLSETEVTLDSDLKNCTDYLLEPNGNNLLIWNTQRAGTLVWGSSWTQYLWTITPSGTISKETVLNTTGETSGIYGLQAAHFDGNYCFFISAYSTGSYIFDTRKVYIWNRSNNTMTNINNPNGKNGQGSGSWVDYYRANGWSLLRGSGDGKIITEGDDSFVVDAVSEKCYANNMSNSYIGDLFNTSSPLIRITSFNGTKLYRDQTYIASINNLATPVVKTAEKTMKIIYRITFLDSDEQAIGEIGGGAS